MTKTIATTFAWLSSPGSARGEEIGLRWDDIDWQRKLICVRRSIGRFGKGPTKTVESKARRWDAPHRRASAPHPSRQGRTTESVDLCQPRRRAPRYHESPGARVAPRSASSETAGTYAVPDAAHLRDADARVG